MGSDIDDLANKLDRNGNPKVFNLNEDDGQLKLNTNDAKPDNKWNDNNKLVFRLRKPVLSRTTRCGFPLCYNRSTIDGGRMAPKKTGVTLDDLAAMVQRGFSEVNEKMNTGFLEVNGRMDRLELGQKETKREVSHLSFLVTELVRREEFLELKQRVQLLETQLAKK